MIPNCVKHHILLAIKQFSVLFQRQLFLQKTLHHKSLKSTKYDSSIKSVRIRSISSPQFPAFGLTTVRYSISLLIHSKYQNNSEYGNFSRSPLVQHNKAYIFPDSYIVIFHSAVHDNCSAYSRRRYCLFWWFLRIRLNIRLKNLYCRLKKIRARPQISLLTLSKLINLETIPKKKPKRKKQIKRNHTFSRINNDIFVWNVRTLKE